jgi:hypothetical protein
LAVPIWEDPDLTADALVLVEELTRRYGAAPAVVTCARLFAEAQTELLRARTLLDQLQLRALEEAGSSPDQRLKPLLDLAISIDRYERRALSRRKFAMRALSGFASC